MKTIEQMQKEVTFNSIPRIIKNYGIEYKHSENFHEHFFGTALIKVPNVKPEYWHKNNLVSFTFREYPNGDHRVFIYLKDELSGGSSLFLKINEFEQKCENKIEPEWLIVLNYIKKYATGK